MARKPHHRVAPRVESLEGRALLTAGALDTTFGGTEQVTTLLQTGPVGYDLGPGSLAIQSDLKTVVVGLGVSSLGYWDPESTGIVRYNVDGSLDTTFGNGGEVVIPTNSDPVGGLGQARHAAISIQADGKIVVETSTLTWTLTTTKQGTTYTRTSNDLLVLRLNSNGSLDTTFGNGGEVDIHLAQGGVVPGGMAILPGGQILVAGSNDTYLGGPQFVVARLTSSGAFDPTFGPSGQGYNYTTVSPSYAAGNGSGVDALGVDASGNILLAGNGYNPVTGTDRPQVVRYTSSGLLDTSFASQGVFDYPTGSHEFNGIGFQPGGQIILGMIDPYALGAGVIRLTSNGTIDPTFGTNGAFWDPNGEVHADVAVQPDGKIVIEMTASLLNGDFLVDRLLPGGTLDSAFGTGGEVVIVPPGNDGNFTCGITVGPDGNITGLDSLPSSPTTEIGVFRLLGDAPITGQLVVTQQPPASLAAGTPFGLTVQVDDSSGNIETSYNGPVTVALASNPGGATLGGMLTTTASNGVATFSGLTLTTAASGYTLDVTGPTLGDALTTAMTVSPSTASQVVITQEPPSSVTAGTGFGLQASVEDAYGNVVTGAGNTVTLALASNPGGATLGGTLTATASQGVATFSGLTLTKAASGYTFQIASLGLGGSLSTALTVTPASAAGLLITQQPTHVVVNSAFTLVAEIVDAYGNLVTSASNSVTIALGNNPTGGRLSGTTTVTAKNGIVTFSGLKLSKVGSGYTILFSSKGLSGTTSGPISVTAS